jgi:prophage antirepressor-like protein
MINDLKIFDYKGNNVRTVQKNNEIWFVLKDVCDVLKLNNPTWVANRLDEDELSQTKFIDSIGRNQEMKIINESGLYNVILRSDKPEAKPFKKWVTGDILPNIRKFGLYATEDVLRKSLENPDFMIDLLLNYKNEQIKRKETEEALQEKTLQLDENQEWFTIKRMAKLNNKYWKSYNWRLLKNTSEYMGYEIKKVFDANYGNVNAYHKDVWEQEYGDCLNL